MVVRSTEQWVDELRPRVANVSIDELAGLLGLTGDDHRADDVIVVDVREIQERVDKGAIPGSRHVPRGMLEFWADPQTVYHRDFFDHEHAYLVHCAGGARSVLAAITLLDMGYRRVSHLPAGFDGWAAAGMPVDDLSTTSKWIRRPS